MKSYYIIELPEDREGRDGIYLDIYDTLQKHGGRFFDCYDRIEHMEAEKLIPVMYCEAREQKEIRAIIEKEIAVGIAQALLERGRIKFTERLDKYGTCVRGTLAVFLEEATDGKAD